MAVLETLSFGKKYVQNSDQKEKEFSLLDNQVEHHSYYPEVLPHTQDSKSQYLWTKTQFAT